jgi:hypothetical protein
MPRQFVSNIYNFMKREVSTEIANKLKRFRIIAADVTGVSGRSQQIIHNFDSILIYKRNFQCPQNED